MLFKAGLDLHIAQFKTELVKWMPGFAAGQVALLVTLLKLLSENRGRYTC